MEQFIELLDKIWRKKIWNVMNIYMDEKWDMIKIG